jgi:hypothetical protein
MVFKKNNLNVAIIRYNELSREIFFLKVCYDGGTITFSINKNNYSVSVEDYELGYFGLTNNNINNTNFPQQIEKILSELGNLVGLEYIGNSMDLEYIRVLSRVRVNGEEIKVDNNKMIDLIDKLFHTTLSYIRNNFSSYHFPLNFDRITIYYTYIYRTPLLRNYAVRTPEYIYTVTYYPVDLLIIYKRLDNNELKEAFRIGMSIYKYSDYIESKVIKLVLQSKIKTYEYIIEIEGKNVTINNKPVKVEDKIVKDITDLIKKEIEDNINNVKNKLNKLA